MTEFFLKRRVTTLVFFLCLVLFGTISLKRLKIDLLPDISFPTLTIITVYENVSPGEIETLVTRPIEEMVSSVSGVDRVTSESLEGVSLITARFRWGTDMDQASIQMREKVDLVKGSLPQDVKKSIVLRFDPNNAPILQVAARPVGIPMEEMRPFIKKNILPYFERTDGIAAVSVSGGLERQVLVHVDRGRLDAHNLGFGDLVSAISSSNFNFPAGNVRRADREVLVRTIGEYGSVASIESTVVGMSKAGVPVFLRSVGSVTDGFRERTSMSFYNGNESVMLILKKEAGKNTVAVASGARDAIEEINLKFKDQIRLDIVADQSIFIVQSISDLAISGFLALGICYLVLLYFLGYLKEPLIILTAVPVSIMVTFILMYWQGLTLNTMSLGGLDVAVGIIVDSSTVVLESIFEVRKNEPDRFKAAMRGTREVASSVLVATISTCVVFLPVGFVEGMAGALFREFALTITYAMIASLLVAMTLVPVLTLIPAFNSRGDERIRIPDAYNAKRLRSLDWLQERYGHWLRVSFGKRGPLFLGVGIIIPVTLLLIYLTPSELMPEVDQGEFSVKLVAQPGTPLEVTARIASGLAEEIQKTGLAEHVATRVGYEEKDLVINPTGDFGLNRAEIFVKLKPGESGTDVADRVREKGAAIESQTGTRIVFVPARSLLADVLSGGGSGLTIEVSGNNLDGVRSISREIEGEFRKIPELSDITTSFQEENPEYRVDLDRDKMALFGLNVQAVAVTLKAALKGEVATKYHENDDEVDVLVRLREADRAGLQDLQRLLIKMPSARNITLDSFARVQMGSSPRKIIRAEAKRIGIVSANFHGVKQSQIMARIQPILARYEQNKDFSVLPGEVDRQTTKSFNALGFAGMLAVVLLYMVLAAQFENFVLPVVVMLSVVVAGIGSIAALLLTGHTLNTISAMGGIMLTGLVISNAIVLIEYYQQNDDGIVDSDALMVAGGRRRLNPILNTTATTILGLLPIAFPIFGNSPQAPMAVAVLGGLTISTVLTLLLIPNAYSYLAQRGYLSRGPAFPAAAQTENRVEPDPAYRARWEE